MIVILPGRLRKGECLVRWPAGLLARPVAACGISLTFAPFAAMGKKRSGSSPWQAAHDIQPKEAAA
jgi:hypothetical protein